MKMFFIFLFCCCCCFAAAVGSHSFCFCCYHQVLNQFALLFRLFVYFVTAFSFTFSILLRYIFVKISAAFDSFFMALNEIIVKKQVFIFVYLFLVVLLSSLPALCSLYIITISHLTAYQFVSLLSGGFLQYLKLSEFSIIPPHVTES